MKEIYIVILIIILTLGSCNVVQAFTESEIEQKRAELNLKIKEAGQNLEEIEVELTKNIEEINKLEEEIYTYENEINEISGNLNKIEIQIREYEATLEKIEKRYQYQKGLLEKRLVYAYKSGKTRYLDVLLSSEDIMDFISKYYFITEMIRYDDNLLKSINNQKNKIIELKNQLQINQENLKIYKDEQKRIIISLENAKVIKNSYINKLTEEELKIKEQLDIYQEELDLIEFEILLVAMEGAGTDYVGGTFAWPAPGYYTITSKYGMRFHPVIKVYTKHSGTDIGTPLGSSIIAANDGIVTKSTYSYSYGNMIMIDHGGGVTTLYAHGSERLVQVGDTVKKGDIIMKAGSTGWSTGPHLHFEIRINGTPIDPYNYIITGITN